MKNKFAFFLGIFLLQVCTACNDSIPEKSVKPLPKDPQVIGVSVWDRISCRSEPRRASSSITLLSLGESFIYMDTFAIDSSYNNTKFLKARLSDSSIVWVYGFASELNATPAVITTEVPLYMRPDLLTITEKRMKVMDIVALSEERDNWVKVVSEKKEKVGWIKTEYISNNKIDLAFALLARRQLEEADQELKIKNIEVLLENNPYPNTIFISELERILDAEKEILRESQDNRDRDNSDRDNRDRDNSNRRRND